MTTTFLQRDDLQLGHIMSLAMSPDGRRVYVGRHISDDQTRENLAVLTIDPQTGAVLRKQLFRDSDQPLPPSYTTPKPARPRSTVMTIVVSARYRKLYLAVNREDGFARPTRFLSIYDLDEQGDPIAGALRTYRADVDSFVGDVGIECMALNPVDHALYMCGGKWTALRTYQLDETGEPIGTQPTVTPLGGNPTRRSLAVSADGTRLYLGTHPLTLEVLRVENGVPRLEPGQGGQPPKPLRTLVSTIPQLSLSGEGYLRFVYTPRRLFAVRGYESLHASGRARPVPLYTLPLDNNGDIAPGVVDWQHVDGFDHVLLAVDRAGSRLWLARETTAAPPAPTPAPDGFELVAYTIGDDGLPSAEVERHPKHYTQQPTLLSVAAASASTVLLSRPIIGAIDYSAGESIRFRIRRATPAPSQPPITYTCNISRYGGPVIETFVVPEDVLSAPIALDSLLAGQPFQVPLNLHIAPAAPGQETVVEAHYSPAGAAPIVKTDTVRGQTALFLLPGYAMTPPEQRIGSFEQFSAHWKRYLAAAEAVALSPDERPDQFVVSGYGLYGGQGHATQLEHGLATLRALGINSVQLIGWQGIPAEELAQRAADFSPESSVYSPPLYSPFAFLYDGSLIDNATGTVIDADYLRGWAEQQARNVAQSSGMSPARVVRFQLADEPGWYFPDVLGLLDHDNPKTPTNQKTDWSDPQRKNAAWIQRFQEYVATNDPDLVAAFGDAWREMGPIGAGQATTPPQRRLFYWSMRFFVDQASEGLQRVHDELQTAFKAQRAPSPRPEHNKLHVHINFGELTDWQWHKPYPNAKGDKNNDAGPDAATGSYDWFRLGSHTGVLPSKHTYMHDHGAQVWSFYADLLRSAATPAGSERPPAFGAFVPGTKIGDIPGGAAYKVLSVIARGAKMVTAYAFGPGLLFPPPNGWADNLAAYAPLADAMRLLGRGQQVLYPGQPERASIAIHLPASSRLWDRHERAPFYYREALPLHTALVHDGYAVDFVDDAALASGVLDERHYTTLYLLGPNLPGRAQRAVAAWVRNGGTLVALPGAATADETNEPTTTIDDVLGVGRVVWGPLRDTAHAATTFGLSHRLTLGDAAWQGAVGATVPLLRDLVADPVAPHLVDFPMLELAGAQTVATLAPLADPAATRPAITRHSVGRGVAYSYAFYPGWQYWCTATHPLLIPNIVDVHSDRLPRNWSTPDRLLATLPARLASTPRSVLISHAAVEARRLESEAGIAIVLFNWTGAPLSKTVAIVRDARQFPRVTSLRHGPLVGQPVDGTNLRVTLPLNDVDVLLFEPNGG